MVTGNTLVRTIRSRKSRLLALVFLIGGVTTAVASPGLPDCELTKEQLVVTKVDYETESAESSREDLELLRDDVRRLESLTLTKGVDTKVGRKLPEDSLATLPTSLAESLADVAEALAEQKLNESKSDEQPETEMKTALPGIDRSKLLTLRERMYRTDI